MSWFLPHNFCLGEFVLHLLGSDRTSHLLSHWAWQATCQQSTAFLFNLGCSVSQRGPPKSPQVIKFSWTFWAFSEMCTDLSPHAVISTVLPHHRRCHRRCELKPWTTQLNSQQLAVWSKPYGQKSRFITQTF